MNTINLTGRLVRDPELRETSTGDPVCALRIAVDGMGRSNSVGYIDVSVWGKPGEACARHIARGWLVGVSGRLEYREWVTDDGAKRSAHAVVGAVDFLAAPRADHATPEPAAA
jgi:single-strand DNA-binding protein